MGFIVNVMIVPLSSTSFDYKQNISRSAVSKPLYSGFSIRQNCLIKPLPCDKINFGGICTDGAGALKELAEYGLTDLYTGLNLLPAKSLEYYQRTNFFDKDLSEVVKMLAKHEDCLLPVEHEVYNLLKKVSKKQPTLKLDEALKSLYPEYQKELLAIQQPVFEELIRTASEMPHKTFCEFMELMNITNKKISKDPVILPFSAKEFIYKLERAALPIKSKNNKKEVRDMRKLIAAAKEIFKDELNINTRSRFSSPRDLDMLLKPGEIMKNFKKMQYLKMLLDNSHLYNNNDIVKIFNTMSARIHYFPTIVPFQRKTFIYDLRKITHDLEDKELANKLMNIAYKLPTSTDEVSAFIVKYANDTPSYIGYNLLLGSVRSIDHLVAKNNGGKNKLFNFGLSSVRINTLKTNMPFDEWVRKHPEIYENAQKHFDILIDLYNEGIFDKVSQGHRHKLTVQYIYDLADTLYAISPKEKPIVIDLSKLNN